MSVGIQLAKIYNLSIPIMLGYLKDINLEKTTHNGNI
jgi:hypothetical protein